MRVGEITIMATFKNIQTGETINVSNVKKIDGEWFFTVRGKGCGTRFYNRNVCFKFKKSAPDGTWLTVADGWEEVSEPKARKPRAPKAPKAPKGEATNTPTPQEQEEAENVPTMPPREEAEAYAEAEEVTEEVTVPTPQPESNEVEDAVAIAQALLRLKGKGAQVDEDTVRRIVNEEIKRAKAGVQIHAVKINDGEVRELPNGQAPHPLLNTLLALVKNDRIIGRYPWLFGPAGSGKSTLCTQVAAAMGLPFYSVSSLQQKYELEGYTDAVGELVRTTFYTAMKEGGIFLFDEASTTSAEVNVAFNSALANLWYNFPKEGMVTAHKDFHVIAADNTAGRGGSNTYHARFEMDGSTLDRYTFVEVGYTDEHDLRMANGDQELVDFIRACRVAIDKANLTYLATPRASKAIKALQAVLDDDKQALHLGLCSGWDAQDTRTIMNAMTGVENNRYFKIFKKIAK